MSPIPLSEWADKNGVARRTAYNWAKSGKLNVPLHRTMTGRLMVLEDDESPESGTPHPFLAAYAEAMGFRPGEQMSGDDYFSDVLAAWGVSLYDAVADELRPVVLQLASAAACQRRKPDVPVRFTDWIGRIELIDWYEATGFGQAVALLDELGEIHDEESFRANWPGYATRYDWQTRFTDTVRELIEQAGAGPYGPGGGAAEALAENSLIGLDNLPLAGRRESLRSAIGALSAERPPGFPLPDTGELWDLRAMYSDLMWALARPVTLHSAQTICELVGWDPDSASPAPGHPLHEVGFPAGTYAAYVALVPHLHAAHLREIDAFRRIALGRPFIPRHP